MIQLNNLRDLAASTASNAELARTYVHSVVNKAMEKDRQYDYRKPEVKAQVSAVAAMTLSLGAAAAFVSAAPVAVLGATLAGAYVMAGKFLNDMHNMKSHRSIADDEAIALVSRDLKSKAGLWEKFLDKVPLSGFDFDNKAAAVLDNAGIAWSTRAKYLERRELNTKSAHSPC